MGISNAVKEEASPIVEDTDSLPKEDIEILKLIMQSKENDEVSIMRLRTRYKELLGGKFIQNLLNFNFSGANLVRNHQDLEDAESIINIIFLEAIASYNPIKSKFITHLTHMIKWKFHQYILRENLVVTRTNRKAAKVKESIEQNQCFPTENIGEALLAKRWCDTVKFRYKDEQLDMPLDLFIDNFIIPAAKTIKNKKHVDIFLEYLNLSIKSGYLKDKSEITTKFGISDKKLRTSLNYCNKRIKEYISKKGIKEVVSCL